MSSKEDSPCNGVCRMEGTRCISCFRTYDDLEQWYYLSREARLKRMREILRERMKPLTDK